MTHTEIRTQTDTWEVEICDECGHDVSQHYDIPLKITNSFGNVAYEASGCMVLCLADGR
jgi:hypothetical protein